MNVSRGISNEGCFWNLFLGKNWTGCSHGVDLNEVLSGQGFLLIFLNGADSVVWCIASFLVSKKQFYHEAFEVMKRLSLNLFSSCSLLYVFALVALVSQHKKAFQKNSDKTNPSRLLKTKKTNTFTHIIKIC